jgi:hypothetical protein
MAPIVELTMILAEVTTGVSWVSRDFQHLLSSKRVVEKPKKTLWRKKFKVTWGTYLTKKTHLVIRAKEMYRLPGNEGVCGGYAELPEDHLLVLPKYDVALGMFDYQNAMELYGVAVVGRLGISVFSSLITKRLPPKCKFREILSS